MKKFIDELKRRNVIKSALAYLVVAWILLQVLTVLLPIVDAPDWILKGLTLLLAIGLPIWIIVSWIYDITPQGIEKTAKDSGSELVTQATNKRLNGFIIVSLSIAVIVLTLKVTNVFSSDTDKRMAIAILPFDNMNADEDDDWFSRGLSIDIHTYLSKIKNLTVINERSVNEALASNKSMSEIAVILNVSHFLSGSVRQLKNNAKITVHLTDANSDKDIWGDDYTREIDDAYKVQREVSREVVKQLEIKLSPKDIKTLEKLPTENMEAYNLYSKGRLINDSREKEDLEKNIELNMQAIALDSTYAEAYAEVGQSILLLGFYHLDYNEGIKRAMPYLNKALELDPKMSRALAAKGIITSNQGHWPEAQGYFEKAVTASPSDATIHYQYALHLFTRDANKHFEHVALARELDPMSAQIGHQYFASLINSNKIEEAEQYYNNFKFLFTFKGEQLEKESILLAYKNKDWTIALQFLETELKKDPDNASLNRELGLAFDGILLDNSNCIKYMKKAYELDSINEGNAYKYFAALLQGEKFNDADRLMQTKNFKSILSKSKGEELNLLFEYYLAKEDYEKVEEVLKDSLMNFNKFNKTIYNAKIGNRKAFDSLLRITSLNDQYKAVFYANLKEKDSMYYYLGNLKVVGAGRNPNGVTFIGLRYINSWKAFDPYRKEERYKALLRKNYLPITKWNE